MNLEPKTLKEAWDQTQVMSLGAEENFLMGACSMNKLLHDAMMSSDEARLKRLQAEVRTFLADLIRRRYVR